MQKRVIKQACGLLNEQRSSQVANQMRAWMAQWRTDLARIALYSLNV